MRVTNKMLSNNFLSDMRLNLENLRTIQQQMTSGKEIRRPSDNPFKVARAMQLHTNINVNKQYNENINDASNFLDTTDTALGQAGNVLQRIRELLVSSGNAGYGPNERKAIKDEINQKIGQFSQILNTNFDGKYIFGGTRGTTKPVDVLNPYVSSISSVTSPAGAAQGSVIGSYTGTSDASFQVKTIVDTTNGKITGYQISKDNGKTWTDNKFSTPKDIDKPLDIDLGQGIKLHIEANGTNKLQDNGIYSFSCTVQKPSENTKLIYNKKGGGELDTSAGAPQDHLDEFNMIKSDLVLEISQGVVMQYNVSASDVINYKDKNGNEHDLRDLFRNIVNHLDGMNDDGTAQDPDTVSKLNGEDLQGITDAISNLLSVRSEVGAKHNRMESAKDKNEEENFNMTEILSKTEDIDMTEKTMEYATMITVYMASLQTSAKVIQPTLMDYLR